MIYTRFGSKILSVTWFDDSNGEVGYVVERKDGSKGASYSHSSHLKADGGIREIWEAAKQIRYPRNPGTDPREV